MLLDFSAMAQDVITLKNGTDINALVQEIGDIEIKYKNFDNPNGPNYTLKKTEILIIRYANGSKDVFSKEAEPVEKKDISMPESTSVKRNENVETVSLPGNAQNRNDVIVRTSRGWFDGFQAKITRTNYKHIYYVVRGKEKKIKQKKVAFTLSFDEKFKQEKYPAQMNMQDFSSFPTYRSGKNWVVFGTDRMSNLSQINKSHPDIYNDFTKGVRQTNTGAILTGIGVITVWPLIIPGLIINTAGVNNINHAFTNYYSTCVDLDVCAKYGIIVTPYNTSLNLK